MPPPSEGVQIIGPDTTPAPPPAIIIGRPPSRPQVEEAVPSPWTMGLEELRLEAGYLTDSHTAARSVAYLHALAALDWHSADRDWELRLAARLDGYHQSGRQDLDELALDSGESFLRWRHDDLRLTLGAQTLLWGRVDEIPPTDQLGVQDLSRYVLDELPQRRRAAPALRLEWFNDPVKVDLVWLPVFREAQLPDGDSLWFPVDTRRGRLAGVRTPPALAGLLRQGSVGDVDGEGGGGGGGRFSATTGGLDYALTLARVRRSLPYYQLDPRVRAGLLQGLDPAEALAGGNGPTFREIHPWRWVVGADLGRAVGNSIWRLEAAWLSDVPVTTTTGRLERVAALDWVAGAEFYPGDGDLRLNLQLGGRELFDTPAILDRDSSLILSGEWEQDFARGRWRWTHRFAVGLDRHDLYFNPQIHYLGLEPHDFYLTGHFFSGDEATVNGFYRDNDLVMVGWRARF